jgi:hypothetical protein
MMVKMLTRYFHHLSQFEDIVLDHHLYFNTISHLILKALDV